MTLLEKKVSEEEDRRILEKLKDFPSIKKLGYYEGYADAILYTNKLTIDVYRK